MTDGAAGEGIAAQMVRETAELAARYGGDVNARVVEQRAEFDKALLRYVSLGGIAHEARSDARRISETDYRFVLEYVVIALANQHRPASGGGCRKNDCRTCRELRDATAAIAAFRQLRGEQFGEKS